MYLLFSDVIVLFYHIFMILNWNSENKYFEILIFIIFRGKAASKSTSKSQIFAGFHKNIYFMLYFH